MEPQLRSASGLFAGLGLVNGLDDAVEELLQLGGQGGGNGGDLAGGELAEGGGEVGERSG